MTELFGSIAGRVMEELRQRRASSAPTTQTVLLTINYRASGASLILPFPNAVEARRELLRRADKHRWQRLGLGSIGSLVNRHGTVRASYTIEPRE